MSSSFSLDDDSSGYQLSVKITLELLSFAVSEIVCSVSASNIFATTTILWCNSCVRKGDTVL